MNYFNLKFKHNSIQGCQIFKPKIPILVNFGGPWNGKGWYIVRSFETILQPFGIYYGNMVI
jgi:hypothetical protein